MPAESGQSKLLKKYGEKFRKSAEAHKADEIEYGNMELPSGIESGVAQLVDCKIDAVKAGKKGAGDLYFYARGIVKIPTHVGDIPVYGLATQITEMIGETPERSRKTMDEHVKWVQNQIKMLLKDGPDDATDYSDYVDADNLEDTMTKLKRLKPFFRFRTWKGSKQTTGPYKDREPRVNHTWLGRCKWNPEENGAATAGVSDDSSGETEVDTDNEMEPDEDPDAVSDSNDEQDADTVQDDSQNTEADEFGDLDSLLERANEQNREAEKTLTEFAVKAGMSIKEVKEADSWQDVVDYIRSQSSTSREGEEGAGDEPEWEPEVNSHYLYAPINPKTKKPDIDPKKKKPITVEVSVTAVDKDSRTATLKNMDNKKILYKNVPWDSILVDE
jgi:hypothetical protein